MTQPAVFLIDGSNLAFRAFHGMPELTRADGFPTGALHGWLRTLWQLQDAAPGARLEVVFDHGGDARRLALLPTYKANRSEMPEALSRQWPLLGELAGLMGAGVHGAADIEADDLVASAAAACARRGETAAIVSSDKDFGQCVGGPVTQWAPPPTANPKLGWRVLDAAGIEEKLGVPPAQVAELLALVGDTSDNIPGIDGVGPKTAAAWLKRYGTLEEILAHCGELAPARFQQVVYARREDLRRNLQLTRLRTDLDVPAATGRHDLEALVAFLEAHEMRASADQARRRAAR